MHQIQKDFDNEELKYLFFILKAIFKKKDKIFLYLDLLNFKNFFNLFKSSNYIFISLLHFVQIIVIILLNFIFQLSLFFSSDNPEAGHCQDNKK